MKIINPATYDLIAEIQADDHQQINQKYQRARGAISDWASRPLTERIGIIRRFHQLLDEQREQIAQVLTKEVGKPLQEARNEVNGARHRIDYFLNHSQDWLTTKEAHNDGKTSDVLAFEPLGVVCNISAWNYPLLVGVNVFIPALIAGNTVLYKPSEYATLVGLELEKLLHQSGVPKDAFIPVLGGGPAGETLLDLPCDGYFFTGSYKTGAYIAQKVSTKLVPVGLELGGKDPLYVTDDLANLEQTAAAVAEGVFYNNGQSCCAVERVYVHQKIYTQFMQAFITEVEKLKTGSPLSAETTQGAITRTSHLQFLEQQVQDALSKGAKLRVGGKRGERNFFPPTVLENVNHQMSLMKEETFGPLIGVMSVANDEEAINLMNDTEYGLTAAVYSQDIERAKTILAAVDSGTSYINCCDRVSPYLPWSGRKHSGLGSTLSHLGILAFAKPRGWHIRS
jgi:acyl-CoA reductase-like NAD-dependent aldehyde dehydrogenase